MKLCESYQTDTNYAQLLAMSLLAVALRVLNLQLLLYEMHYSVECNLL
jgi:hypothetical protein